MTDYNLPMVKKCIISPNTAGRLIRRNHTGEFSPACKAILAEIMEDFTAEIIFRAKKIMQARRKKRLTPEILRSALR